MAFTFNPESRKQFDWLLTRYPSRRAVLLPALRLVEEQQGFIDTAAMDYVAAELQIPPAVVSGVFTFYTHYRRPTDGKYVVMVCATLPCALRGAQMVADAFKAELQLRVGETSADKLFSLRKVECLGSCNTAPVCQINDDYFEHLTPEKIKEIVADLKAGRPPRHLSNGPALDGGRCSYHPMIEAVRP